ncbi:hypothetical protein MST27_17110 [Pseudomonas sp. PS1]|uniref:Uncharacterized protein n=1 Tax=Stutzerimonas marianensis TaxID=2929513 RepID=A0A9X2ATI3_9GAMM|nr:hypothetical protein [Pseudomonas marianensis]MCJ0975094.1 hypothetical protein [Pseudomonas marianensis]
MKTQGVQRTQPLADELPSGSVTTFSLAIKAALQRQQPSGDDPHRLAKAGDEPPAFKDYQDIEAPDATGAGIIRYETRDGEKVTVSQAISPALYEQLCRDYENLKAVKDAVADDYRRAGADDQAPASIDDYLAIEQPAPEVLRFRMTQGGDWIVVAKGDNPEMFDDVLAHKGILDGIRESERDGYRRATDNEVWPPAGGTTIGPLDEVGQDLIRFEHDGDKVVVYKHDNPKLFDYLSRLRALMEDPQARNAVEGYLGEGYALARREGEPPAFFDFATFAYTNEFGSTGAIAYTTHDGDRVVVSRFMTPELYAQVEEIAEAHFKLNDLNADGWGSAGATADFDADQIHNVGFPDNGVVTFEVEGQGKFAVSELSNKALYDKVMDAKKATSETFTGIDIGTLETSAKDKDGKTLTVDELTWQNLLDSWKADIDAGKIKHDDDRAKLVRALQAKGALEGGIDMTSLDISSGRSLTHVGETDLEDIIDRDKLDATIEALLQTDAVSEDYGKARKAALDELPNKDEIFERIERDAMSADYARHLALLKADNKDDVAQANIAKTYASLHAIDPEKADAFLQQLQLDTVTLDLANILSDPGSISQENLSVAAADTLKTLFAALKKAGVDIPRRTVESIDKFINELLKDSKTADALNKLLVELGDRARHGTLTENDLRELVKTNPTYTALDKATDGGLLNTLAQLNKVGMLGSAGGMISLFSGIYQLAGKGGTLADTPEERVSIARDFISFVGAGQHFTTLFHNVSGRDSAAVKSALDTLGLDRSFQEIWTGSSKPAPEWVPAEGENADTPRTKVQEQLRAIIDANPADAEDLRTRANLTEDQLKEVLKGYKGGAGGYISGLPEATRNSRIFTSALKVLNLVGDGFSGVADLVIGALKLDKAKGDKALIAEASMTIAAGGLTTIGAGASLGNALGLTLARALTAPFFWAGAIVSFITLGFSIYHDIKLNNALKDNQKALADLFKDFEADGLLVEDGGKRYEFLDEYIEQYGQRDAPDDQSIFDYRSDEYEYFKEKGHTYWDGQHEDYKGDGDNLDTQMDRGSTVGS